MRCLKCETPVLPLGASGPERNLLGGAGFLDVSFHYGSVHDQMDDYGRTVPLSAAPDRRERLLHCHQIRAYVCDACFERYIALFDGYDPDAPAGARPRLNQTV